MVSTAFDMFIDRIESLGLRYRFESLVREYGSTLGEIFSHERRNSIVLARRRCMRVLRDEMAKSDVEIATIFDRTPQAVMKLLRSDDEDRRYGRMMVERPKTGVAVHPMPDVAGAQRALLISLARELEALGDSTNLQKWHDQAEGVRRAIRIVFPVQPP
ncbi:MAG: hypothetical protein ACYDH4_09570 [Candidatus Cryosericum sp.]